MPARGTGHQSRRWRGAKFATAKHFGSWLGLCPDNRITGAKSYSVRTRDVKSRVAEALRLGSPKAITAMAHT